MLTSLLVVLPIFGVIAAGYISGRIRLLGPTAGSELNRFVVYLALPALLFEVMANANWSELRQPAFIAAFSIGALSVYAVSLVFRMARGKTLAQASIDGLNASYPNAGYVGFPLCDMVFGPESLAFVTVAVILVVCGLFAIAVLLVEIGVQTERRPHKLVFKVGRSLLRNPLLAAPLVGAAWSTMKLPLVPSVESFVHLLGSAASPCALVSLGLFLSTHRRGAASARAAAVLLSAMKLIAQPAITAVCVYGIFGLGGVSGAVAVLISALPTGTGPFMIAELYDIEASTTSYTILYSTIASVITLAVCLAFVAPR